MELLEVVQSTRQLLAKPSKWTKSYTARDKDDRAVGWDKPEACKWDIEGALRYNAGDVHQTIWRSFRPIAVKLIGKHRNLFDWERTPSRTHRDVINLLDDIIDEVKWSDGDGTGDREREVASAEF